MQSGDHAGPEFWLKPNEYNHQVWGAVLPVDECVFAVDVPRFLQILSRPKYTGDDAMEAHCLQPSTSSNSGRLDRLAPTGRASLPARSKTLPTLSLRRGTLVNDGFHLPWGVVSSEH